MKKLFINTDFPDATYTLLRTLDLVESQNIELKPDLIMNYHSDTLSQELYFWLALAQGCGLIKASMLVEKLEE